ncbi:MAG: DUF86 domain-containing protein [Deltaproteobacteria bacterium]|jgi:uncharacterized protein YutE (UPF0331/DUF86 family)|uniref:type VII toxin-antitoxin system HepT family RNase toxin n=1 Tax=Desulfobacula sp. TaxID=2593537 RepID=UPI001D5CEA3F|nr:DUF86 domain-containing protein [Desulfobacteraceae bacterium]MBT4639471.1 DUF86 domain-containing protein [Deltaproteobacteria bacterium]MBT6751691.1 DUF86 domain-containing protein [Desulfobacula sp.]MBT6499297.1 DUF86 domain-containing protein [Deltaproteobacteria bacterium]MBT7715931.1 DUF86 domain-containing protein [Deltaproteobacteria bacterium]
MDKNIILSKIESLQRCTERIKEKTPASSDMLMKDWDLQDIIVLNLQRATQVCVDIASHIISQLNTKTPMTMADTFSELQETEIITAQIADRMIKSISFRNISVHQYQDIDWNIVYSIITCNLDDFKEFAKEVLRWINQQ